jgi:hypothetical protein
MVSSYYNTLGIITLKNQTNQTNRKLKIKTITINEITRSKSIKKETNHRR